jgi:PQQ-dependent dehydrogenase (methanol/ethanol family)
MNSLKKFGSYNKLVTTFLTLTIIIFSSCTETGDKKETATSTAAVADVDWPNYGGNQWGERHAQFKQITKNNVAHMVPRRVLQLGHLGASLSASPLVVDGILYVSLPDGIVQAYDLRTGKRKWDFQHKLDLSAYAPSQKPSALGARAPACCSNTSRGLAYADKTIFLATLDAKMIAIDAETGKAKWEVWGVLPKDNPQGIYGYNSAPVIAGNLVVIGSTGGESPTRHHLTAFDQKTGKQVWRWYTIPAPDGSDPLAPNGWWGDYVSETAYGQKLEYRDIEKEKANQDKYKESWKIGGGPLWMPGSYDPELNLIFIGTGNPNPDMDGRGRPGDNLYTNSVVAIDATTGKTKWYFQESPHDLWDRDAVSPPAVMILNGRKVVVHAGKLGFMFVLDAETGDYISMSETFVPQLNVWVAPSETPVTVYPSGVGGNEWSPISVDRERKLGFVGAVHWPVTFTLEAEVQESEHLGRSTEVFDLGGDWTFEKGSKGYFSAIDLTTGKIKWQVESPKPYVGGVFSTSTGLVFQGESDGNLTAFDSDTGELLWQYNTGAGVNAPPIAFTLDGEEFIAVASGGSAVWGSAQGDAVFVFGLPKKWEAAKK